MAPIKEPNSEPELAAKDAPQDEMEPSKHDRFLQVINQDSVLKVLWSLNLEIHHALLFTLAVLVTGSGVITILLFMLCSLLLTLHQLRNL